MNFLLTGGTGYLGSHAAVVLALAGHRAVLLDNLANNQADVVDRIGRITGQHPVFVRGDVRDYIHVMDLAEGRLAALGHLTGGSGAPFEVFNLSSGRGYSVLEVVAAFERAAGRPH